MHLSEDARYLTSTQYRLWSFTPTQLYTQRSTTNRNAVARIKASINPLSSTPASTLPSTDVTDTDTADETSQAPTPLRKLAHLNVQDPIPEWELNVEDELKLVAFYGKALLKAGDHLGVATDVKSTALQYLKRFYLTHSVLTYPPTAILKTALFFATKTENFYTPLSRFCEAIGKTTEKDVLAYEFLLTQGLRFNFEVKHPFRALEGAVMEIQALAESDGTIPVMPGGKGVGVADVPVHTIKRVRQAHGVAKDILKGKALLSDVYFHYTPSQIMFAALLEADTDLANWYLGLKIPDSTIMTKLSTVLSQCRQMMNTVKMENETEEEVRELKVLAAKLKRCQKLVGAHGMQGRGKREGEAEEERIAKKRKMERDSLQNVGEQLFGPELGRAKAVVEDTPMD